MSVANGHDCLPKPALYIEMIAEGTEDKGHLYRNMIHG